MFKSGNEIKSELLKYSNKDTKLGRLVKQGKLFRIKNGLYETDPNVPDHLIANGIYGPSYISFDYALAMYGLIPERVNVVTSATFNKKKKKKYHNHFGDFIYRDVPELVYSLGITLVKEGNRFFQIAKPEKALCDKLYTLRPLRTIENLEYTLFEDLRIDYLALKDFDIKLLKEISGSYKSTNVTLLYNYMKNKYGGKNE